MQTKFGRYTAFSGKTQNGLYHYAINAASFSTVNSRVVLQGLSLKPISVRSFFNRARTDRFSSTLESAVLEGFDYRGFLDTHALSATKVSGYHGRLAVFGSPRGKFKPGDRITGFPHVVLRKLKTRLLLDTLDLSRTDITYSEYNKESGQTGTIRFQNTSARFLNVSNDPVIISAAPWCRASISTSFLGKSLLQLHIRFNLTDKKYAYNYEGYLGPLPAPALNPVSIPLGLARVISVELTTLDFAISADRYRSTGTMHMRYHDLRVELLNSNQQQKLLKTIIVNAFVLKHNNLDEAGKPERFAQILYLRPKSYPFFKTLWQTLFTGIKACAGIGPSVQPERSEPHESLAKKIIKAAGKVFKRSVKAKNKADQQQEH